MRFLQIDKPIGLNCVVEKMLWKKVSEPHSSLEALLSLIFISSFILNFLITVAPSTKSGCLLRLPLQIFMGNVNSFVSWIGVHNFTAKFEIPSLLCRSKEGILLISYCFQGCQNGSRSPQFLLSNCEKVCQ